MGMAMVELVTLGNSNFFAIAWLVFAIILRKIARGLCISMRLATQTVAWSTRAASAIYTCQDETRNINTDDLCLSGGCKCVFS